MRTYARDQNLSKSTHMHEGWMSTNLGLRGEPSLSEELIVMRDLEILKYSGGILHFSRISSAKSIEMIRKAKEDGLCVTADVGIGHLIFTDQSVGDFDTNYKVLPVFRSEKDRKALIEGIKSGVIDAICSNHRPQDQENKQLEFDLAQPGTISLQSFAPALLMIQNEIPLELLLDKVAHGPRKVLRKNDVVIEEGLPAKLTILDAYKKWILNEENNLSKSRNSPFWGKELTGKVFGTINGEQYSVANI